MAKIYAPYTDGQVAKLKEWQSGFIAGPDSPFFKEVEGVRVYGTPVHPFTCDGGHKACERETLSGEGVLIVTTDGLVCPCGKYTQAWCHDFMAE